MGATELENASEFLMGLALGERIRIGYGGIDVVYVRAAGGVRSEETGSKFPFEKFDGWTGQTVEVLDNE